MGCYPNLGPPWACRRLYLLDTPDLRDFPVFPFLFLALRRPPLPPSIVRIQAHVPFPSQNCSSCRDHPDTILSFFFHGTIPGFIEIPPKRKPFDVHKFPGALSIYADSLRNLLSRLFFFSPFCGSVV